jgi:hypothetical protein
MLMAVGGIPARGQSVLDPEQVYRALSGLRSPKTEFETTADYQQRLANILHQDIAPGVSLESPLPFLLNQAFVGSTLPVAKLSYDADSEFLKVSISTTPVGQMAELILKTEGGEVGHYTGQNAFGATADVSRMHSEDYGITFDRNTWLNRSDIITPIPRDQARIVYSHLRLILVCKAVQPYVTSRFQHLDPTLDSPIDSNANGNLIVVEPLELRLYDEQTGQVLKVFTEASVRAEFKQRFPIHLEVEANYFTQENLLYQIDDDLQSPMRSTGMYSTAYNGGRPFLIADAKSQIKIAGMDKRTLSKLVFRLNGQVISPNWYPEKYVFLGTTFAKYSAIIRKP